MISARITLELELPLPPLRFGAGVKGKIGEAWSHGVPVVMTEVGADGMQVVHGKTALVANEPESFAQAVLQLLNDDTLWFSLSEQGRIQLKLVRSLRSNRLRRAARTWP